MWSWTNRKWLLRTQIFTTPIIHLEMFNDLVLLDILEEKFMLLVLWNWICSECSFLKHESVKKSGVNKSVCDCVCNLIQCNAKTLPSNWQMVSELGVNKLSSCLLNETSNQTEKKRKLLLYQDNVGRNLRKQQLLKQVCFMHCLLKQFTWTLMFDTDCED